MQAEIMNRCKNSLVEGAVIGIANYGIVLMMSSWDG